MATLIKPTRTGTCTNCLGQVLIYARMHGLGSWALEGKCPCGHIRESIDWPFAEENSVTDVGPGEFLEHNILLNLCVPDDNDDAGYNHDIDHGWEDNFYGSFME
jgi:hypothetical protein